MTVSRIKVRLPTKFPSSVTAASPLVLANTGGNFAFSFDVAALRVSLDPFYLTVNLDQVVLNGATSGTITVLPPAIAGSNIITLPAATDTLVGKATTDTLTNKTYDTAGTGNSFKINGVAVTANQGTGAVVRDTSPTLTTPVIGVATGTSLAATGLIKSSGTAGIGYATGAGGAVTQATSRTTGVQLDKTSGAITLFAAAPAVGTWVSCTVTNSTVAATDTISLSVQSSNAANTYIANVTAVAAGSFRISFTTIVGTTSDSPVLNFNVIKGVAA